MAIVVNRRASDLRINLLTALAGGTIAALGVVVAPAGLLEALVVRLGLPALLPAAAPPLGGTARMMIAAGAFIGVALAVGVLMTILTQLVGRKPRRAADPDPAPEFLTFAGYEGEAPALRRADAHPDAPPRRPIFAGADLGTPFQDIRAKTDAIDEDLIEPLALDAFARDESALDTDGADVTEVADDVAEPAPPEPFISILRPGPVMAPRISTPESAEPRTIVIAKGEALSPPPRDSMFAVRTPLPDAAPAPVEPAEEPTVVDDARATHPMPDVAREADPVRRPAPLSGRETTADLLRRLEEGLQRRAAARADASAVPMSPPRRFDNDADAALRDALGSLRRMALRSR